MCNPRRGRLIAGRPATPVLDILALARPIVYRLYDSDLSLLYVGKTDLPLDRRLQGHARDQLWWREVAFATTEPFASEEEALTAEAKAIWKERPRYNVMGRNPWPWDTRFYTLRRPRSSFERE